MPLNGAVGRFILATITMRAAMFPGQLPSPETTRVAFDAVLACVVRSLAGKCSCVIDGATFSRDDDRARVDVSGARHGAHTRWVFLDCPVDLARSRVFSDFEQGIHLAADRTPSLVDDVACRMVPPPADALVLDARMEHHLQVALVLDWLMAFGGPD